jgi:hypothetical protein
MEIAELVAEGNTVVGRKCLQDRPRTGIAIVGLKLDTQTLQSLKGMR